MPADASDIFSIVGIDPGTETLGFACIKLSLTSLDIVGTYAHTFIGSKLGMNEWTGLVHTNRMARLDAHRQNLIRQFEFYEPNHVVCESPFFNPTRPNAFAPLVETIDTIRRALQAYDNCMPLYLVDPPTLKKAVGATGGAKKDAVRDAVLKLADKLNYQGDTPLEELSEHAIDGIGAGLSKVNEIVTHLQRCRNVRIPQ